MAQNLPPQEHAPGQPAASSYLTIVSGKSNFKQRPINVARFLIGAGNTCHLQLGGAGIPMVHSIIEQSAAGLRISSLVSAPALLVNQQTVRSSQLTDGDVLTIGSYRFQFHQDAEAVTATLPFTKNVEPKTSVVATTIPLELDLDDEEMDLEQLSATELVDLIEQEMTMLQEQEDAERKAARSLYDAIVQRAHQQETEEDDELFAEEELQILDTLAELSENLEDCQSQLNATPGQDESRIQSLLSTQEKLLSRLEDAISWLREADDDQQKQSA
ncbi:FHA domain-containing protein [Lacunimicrobium album]